jgi:dihydrofolate reductase
MRELTADVFVSLDEFAAGAEGGQRPFLAYAGPEFQRYVRSVLDEPQLMIMGRSTYKLLSTYWPSASGPEAERMNSLPKLVFSKTLKEPLAWNARLAKGDLAEEIQALKRQSGGAIRSIGSLKLVQSMMKLGLADRVRLVVFPIVFGRDGREPVFDGLQTTGLDLIGTTVLDSKIIVLEYRPVKSADQSSMLGTRSRKSA